MNTKALVVPVVIIVLGVAWLLTAMHVIPGVDWLWVAALAAAGLLVVFVGGINKLTMVTGPFLLVCSFVSLLRQVGKLPINLEVPILTIVLGCIMLVVQILNVPMPDMLSRRQTEE